MEKKLRIIKLLTISVNEKPKPGAPKVVKRRAPAPISDGPDISISRPVVTKIDHSKGMIPPPPLKIQMPTASTSGIFTNFFFI